MDEPDRIHKKLSPMSNKELEAVQSLQLICKEVGESLEYYAAGNFHEAHTVLSRSLDRICDGMLAYNCKSEPGKYFSMMFNSVSLFQTDLASRIGGSDLFGNPSRIPPYVKFQRREVLSYLSYPHPAADEGRATFNPSSSTLHRA